jgi:hypothetical protein
MTLYEPPDTVPPNRGRTQEPKRPATRALWRVIELVVVALCIAGAVYWLAHR